MNRSPRERQIIKPERMLHRCYRHRSSHMTNSLKYELCPTKNKKNGINKNAGKKN